MINFMNPDFYIHCRIIKIIFINLAKSRKLQIKLQNISKIFQHLQITKFLNFHVTKFYKFPHTKLPKFLNLKNVI